MIGNSKLDGLTERERALIARAVAEAVEFMLTYGYVEAGDDALSLRLGYSGDKALRELRPKPGEAG